MYVKASKNFHNSMLTSVLSCNMRFFESTPIGRILNRFSKDIDHTETKIPETFRSFVRFSFNVSAVLLVISITLPLFIIFLLPLFLFYYLIQRFYLNLSRQIKRIDSSSSSHIYSFYGESLNGISTIRAFKAQNRFIEQMQQHVDLNLKIHYSNLAIARYFFV